MGWFSSSKEPAVIHASDRKRCWAARDTFFQCLDRIGVEDAIKDSGKANKGCPQEVKDFEKACVGSWVQYFKQKRVADINRQRRIAQLEGKGYMPLDSSAVTVTEVKEV